MNKGTFPATLLLACLAWPQARTMAAESYDNCTGFVDSLPATIAKQGTWCLRKDLSTAIASGAAITIAANNVTLDCNDFKVGGLAAGDLSAAFGIHAVERQNAAIRHCAVRGFLAGVYLEGGAGHLVEDNRLDNNLYAGIVVLGPNSLVRRNRVLDTGGSRLVDSGHNAVAIGAVADVLDNEVAGVFNALAGGSSVTGILAGKDGGLVRDNRVSGLSTDGTAIGLSVSGIAARVEGNHVAHVLDAGPVPGFGIYAPDEYGMFCRDNTVRGFEAAYDGCAAESGNQSL